MKTLTDNNYFRVSASAGVLWAILLTLISLSSICVATETGFVSSLTMPYGLAPLGRTGAIYYEADQSEIYVSDRSNNRIVVFDAQGRYVWEFTDSEHLPSSTQIVVDSLGRIYAVGAGSLGSAAVFDFDGTYLHDLEFAGLDGTQLSRIEHMLIDGDNRLLILTADPLILRTYDLSGVLLTENELRIKAFEESGIEMYKLGKPAIINNLLVVPLPIAQTVARFSLDGKFFDRFGEPGGVERKMSFPIAAAGDGLGNILILDKHRHVLIKYDNSGEWVSEFGGFGGRAGRFYHPSSLASNQQGECIVGQIFAGRVQRFRVTGIEEVAGSASLNPMEK